MTTMNLIFHDEKTGSKAWWNAETSEVLISGDTHFAYALAREVMRLRGEVARLQEQCSAPVIPPLVREIMRTWMIREMSSISEEHWCAGWLDNTEFILWRALQQLPEPYEWGMATIDVDRLKRLKEVSDYIGEWAAWDETRKETLPLTVAEWLPMFEDWDRR